MNDKKQPWITTKAFIVAAVLTAIATYGFAADTGFSVEGVSVWIAGAGIGGLFWGAIFTFALRRFF